MRDNSKNENKKIKEKYKMKEKGARVFVSPSFLSSLSPLFSLSNLPPPPFANLSITRKEWQFNVPF